MNIKAQKRFSYAILVFPACFIYLAVVAFPTIFSVILSFTNYNGGEIFKAGNIHLGSLNRCTESLRECSARIHLVGLGSYEWMFTEPNGYFYTSLKNNLYIVAVSVFGQIPLGFILAYILTRKLIKRGGGFFQTMIFLPNVISAVIIGILFRVFINGRESVYLEVVRIFKPDTVYKVSSMPMIPVLFVVLWMFTGFYMIIFLAHMQRIDPAIIEAARIDGAGEGGVLRHIILPAMTSEIVTCSILAISGSLRTFDLIYGMTSGGPAGQTRVLSLYMYESAFLRGANYPLANAISTIMVIISVILIIVVRQVAKLFAEREEA